MVAPSLSEVFKTTVAICRRQVDTKQGSHFPVEITETALGPFHCTDYNFIMSTETMGQKLKRLRLAHARLATDHRETAVHGQAFQSVYEIFLLIRLTHTDS